MSEQPLAGLRAIVTGGGKGIGAAIACELSNAGAQLVVMGRTAETLKGTAAKLTNAQAIVVDVTDVSSVEKAFAQAGPADILINNAGSVESASFGRTDEALWRRMMAVNLDGAFYCTKQVLKGMREKGFGRIVNLASTASLKGYPYVTAYCAAKHGLLGLTRSLALETAPHGITVNAVCPGYTETDLLSGSVKAIVGATGRSEEEACQILLQDNPQGRFIQPAEVAATVLWLCSPQAKSITGQAIAVAGGEVM
jgi:3-hydroxybutyrate dehydrogenase